MINTSAPTLALINGQRYRTHWRLLIEGPTGTMQDLSTLGGYDWRRGFSFGKSVDNPVANGEITLLRQVNGVSLMPLVDGSAVNSAGPAIDMGRRFQLLVQATATTAAANPANWQLLEDGVLQKVRTQEKENRIVLPFLDRSILLNKIIRTQTTYGDPDDGVAVETVMQQIIDDHIGSSVFSLQTLGSPSYMIRSYTPFEITVREALLQLSQPFAGFLDYRWSQSLGRKELFLISPDRENTTPVATIGRGQYRRIDDLEIDLAGMRNLVQVRFRNRATGNIEVATADLESSIELYGEQYLRVTEAEASLIDTPEEAQDMADRLLLDTADQPITQRVNNWFWFPVELNDMIQWNANPRLYDSNLLGAVYGFRHAVDLDKSETVFETSPRARGGYKRWIWAGRNVVSVTDRPQASIRVEPLLAGEDPNTTARFTLEALGPAGTTLQYRTRPGENFLVASSNPLTLPVSRATGEVAPLEIVARAVSPDGTYDEAGPVVWDWDTLPSVRGAAPSPWLDAVTRLQLGWESNVAVDDDTRGLLLEFGDGLTGLSSPNATLTSLGGGAYWVDTTSLKTFTLRASQAAGARGTYTLTPYRNSEEGDRGADGPPLVQTVERHPVTRVTTSEVERGLMVRITVDPATADILYRIGGSGDFTTVTGPVAEFPVDVSGEAQTLEYYGRVTDGPTEPMQTLQLDRGAEPYFDAVVAEESANNRLTIRLVGLDDDCERFAVWARPASLPYLLGEDSEPTGEPDPFYLKDEGPTTRQPTSFYAVAATWHIIARAYGRRGLYLERTTSLVITGSIGAQPELSSLGIQLIGSSHRLTWAHNSEVDGANRVAVRLRSNGVTQDVLPIAAARPATWEPGAESDTVASSGGYDVPVQLGSTYRKFDYEIMLYDGDQYLKSYNLSIEGAVYAGGTGGPPATAPTDLFLMQLGPNVNANWVNSSNTLQIELAYQISVNGTWQALTSAMKTAGSQNDTAATAATDAGDVIRFYARYVNSYGGGQWSAPSNVITVS